MKKYAVIVAGGSGSRMGGGIPKQFRTLCGRPMLWWSMKAFHEEDPETKLILVLPADFLALWNDFYTSLPDGERFDHEATAGGVTRTESVRKGLSLVSEDSLVAVHDGARPLVSANIISRGWETAREKGAAVPVVPVTDSLRLLEEDGSQAVDRSQYVAVQTPQVFRSVFLKKAYENAEGRTFTDDASLMEHAGHKVALFEGSHDNIKITTPADMAVATVIMGKDA